MKTVRLNELIHEALETEQGGIKVYETALRCAQHPELREEWRRYLDETREHERVLREVCERLALDAGQETPGRLICRHVAGALVRTMELALATGDAEVAEVVAAECVVHAETKDHLNWELIGLAARELKEDEREALLAAYDGVEEQEDEHLYHTKGWTRELRLALLGLPAVLPPPEERKDVRSAAAAARAKSEREQLLS
jgi:rubrerythrin